MNKLNKVQLFFSVKFPINQFDNYNYKLYLFQLRAILYFWHLQGTRQEASV